MRSRSVVLGAALLLGLGACDNRAEATNDSESLPPVGLVEEPAASTVVFPGQRLRVDGYGSLIIDTESR